MDQGKFDKYLKDRYEDQLKWYDDKAKKNKKYYILFQTIVIILALIAPVIVGFGEIEGIYKIVAVSISSLVAIGTSLMKTFKYQENWILYRTTAETLRKEIQYYDWELGEYGTADNRRQHFVNRVESILSQENTQWISAQKTKKKEDTDQNSTT
jgi:hypothetical protein